MNRDVQPVMYWTRPPASPPIWRNSGGTTRNRGLGHDRLRARGDGRPRRRRAAGGPARMDRGSRVRHVLGRGVRRRTTSAVRSGEDATIRSRSAPIVSPIREVDDVPW